MQMLILTSWDVLTVLQISSEACPFLIISSLNMDHKASPLKPEVQSFYRKFMLHT